MMPHVMLFQIEGDFPAQTEMVNRVVRQIVREVTEYKTCEEWGKIECAEYFRE